MLIVTNKSIMLIVVMLNVIMLNVVMLNVVMLNVVVPIVFAIFSLPVPLEGFKPSSFGL
jgi:hypothetical protein